MTCLECRVAWSSRGLQPVDSGDDHTDATCEGSDRRCSRVKVFELKRRAVDGRPVWVYRSRTDGPGPRRLQRETSPPSVTRRKHSNGRSNISGDRKASEHADAEGTRRGIPRATRRGTGNDRQALLAARQGAPRVRRAPAHAGDPLCVSRPVLRRDAYRESEESTRGTFVAPLPRSQLSSARRGGCRQRTARGAPACGDQPVTLDPTSSPGSTATPGGGAQRTSRSRLVAVRDWLSNRADNRFARLALLWFRRYFEASRNSGAAASAYITLSVLPAALVFIAIFNLGRAQILRLIHTVPHPEPC